jgi:hypothetical protein
MATKQPTVGDIFEIDTPAGLAYAQYTHDAGHLGQLVRVLPGTYSSRPDVALLAKQREIYFVFYTLEYALRAKHVEIISNHAIPDWAKEPPLMRKAGGLSDEEGRRLNWTIGRALSLSSVEDLQHALKVRGLSPEQAKLSIAALWPHSVMVDKIAKGWRPERDEELNLLARKARKATAVPVAKSNSTLEHFLYFPEKTHAKEAAKRLKAKGWAVEIRMGADGENWLVLAKQPASISAGIEKTREELERLAKDFHGEYDGWGAVV